LFKHPIDAGAFTLTLPDIVTAKQEDSNVTGYLLNNRKRFKLHDYGGNKVICLHASNGQWKIVLPTVLINLMISWYTMD
jgi:hypothetical protein